MSVCQQNVFAGNKENDIDVVYTPASNLKKTGDMDVGQVGFKSSKAVWLSINTAALCLSGSNEAQVKRTHVEKRSNEIINRLEKTKVVDESPDFAKQLEERKDIDRKEAKERMRNQVRDNFIIEYKT